MPSPAQATSRRTGLSGWEVLASLGDSLKVVDRHWRILWARDPLVQRFRPDLSMRGKLCHQIYANRATPCDQDCPVAPVFATGRPQTTERRFTCPDGREMWREAWAYPIADNTGRVIYAVRVSFDITSRKRAEALDQRALENLERSLGELNRLQLDRLPWPQPAEPALTQREVEVLRLVAQGLTKPQIARLLGISVNTAKRHVGNIFNKLGVNDRAQAAVWAAHHDLV